jgi:hypothetical protein
MSNEHSFNLKLEQYLLGELKPKEMAAMEAELAKNPGLRDALEKLKQENAAYYQKYPRLNQQSEPRPAREKFSWMALFAPRLVGGLAFAAACLIAVIFYMKNVPVQNGNTTAKGQNNNVIAMNGNNTNNGVTLKGLKPGLFLATTEPLANGSVVHAGDEIQIAYRASGYRYGVIFSVDAARATTFHFPANFESGESQELRPGSRVGLKHAFKLDDKPGYEKFYFVTAQKPLSHPQLLAVAANGGKVAMPDVEVITIFLKKE